MDVVRLCGKRYRVVMRNHRTTRRRSFHPVHRGAPGNLLGRRLTVIHGGGGRSEVADNWSETWETSGWTGYTLFLQRIVEEPQRPGNQSQNGAQQVAETQLDEIEEDDSFELVEDVEGSGGGSMQHERHEPEPHAGDRSSGPRLRALSLLTTGAGAMGPSLTTASTRLATEEEVTGLKKKVLQWDPQHGAADGDEREGQEPEGEGSPQQWTLTPIPEEEGSSLPWRLTPVPERSRSPSTTRPPPKARPTTRTGQSSSARSSTAQPSSARSSTAVEDDETSAVVPVTEKGPNKGLSKGKGRWFTIQEERHGPMHRCWIPYEDEYTDSDAEAMQPTGEQQEQHEQPEEPESEPPWKAPRMDGAPLSTTRTYALDPEDPNIEQIIESLPVTRVLPPPEPRTRMEAAQMVVTIPRPEGYQTDSDGEAPERLARAVRDDPQHGAPPSGWQQGQPPVPGQQPRFTRWDQRAPLPPPPPPPKGGGKGYYGVPLQGGPGWRVQPLPIGNAAHGMVGRPYVPNQMSHLQMLQIQMDNAMMHGGLEHSGSTTPNDGTTCTRTVSHPTMATSNTWNGHPRS